MKKRTVELNRLHPLVDEMFKRVTVDPKDPVAADIALVLYDVAALQNGFDVKDILALSKRVGRMLRSSVDIASDAPLLEDNPTEFDAEIAEEATEKASDDGAGADDKADDGEDGDAAEAESESEQ